MYLFSIARWTAETASGVPVRSGPWRTTRTPPVNSNSRSSCNHFRIGNRRRRRRRPIIARNSRKASPKSRPPEAAAVNYSGNRYGSGTTTIRFWRYRRRARTRLYCRSCPDRTSRWPYPKSAPSKYRCCVPVFQSEDPTTRRRRRRRIYPVGQPVPSTHWMCESKRNGTPEPRRNPTITSCT